MRNLLVAVLCVLAAGQDLCAQAWQTAASRLQPGVRIRIEKTDSTKMKGTLGLVASRPRMDFSSEGVALFAGIGAGVGALIGWLVRASGGDKLVYDSATN